MGIKRNLSYQSLLIYNIIHPTAIYYCLYERCMMSRINGQNIQIYTVPSCVLSMRSIGILYLEYSEITQLSLLLFTKNRSNAAETSSPRSVLKWDYNRFERLIRIKTL